METLLQIVSAKADRWIKLCEACGYLTAGKRIPKDVEAAIEESMSPAGSLIIVPAYGRHSSAAIYLFYDSGKSPEDAHWTIKASYWQFDGTAGGKWIRDYMPHRRLGTALKAIQRLFSKIDANEALCQAEADTFTKGDQNEESKRVDPGPQEGTSDCSGEVQ